MASVPTGPTGQPAAADITLEDLIQNPLTATQGATVSTPSAVPVSPSSVSAGGIVPLVPPGFEILGDPKSPTQPLTSEAGRALVKAIKEVLRG